MKRGAEQRRSSRSGRGRTFADFSSDREQGGKTLADIRNADHAEKKTQLLRDSIRRARERWSRCEPPLDPTWLGRSFEMNGKGLFEIVGAFTRDDETQIVAVNGEKLAHLGLAFIREKLAL